VTVDQATAAQVADLMTALAAPSRVLILDRLRSGPLPVGELALAVGMEQSAVSHQLRLLRHLGLLTSRRHGRRVFTRCTTATSTSSSTRPSPTSSTCASATPTPSPFPASTPHEPPRARPRPPPAHDGHRAHAHHHGVDPAVLRSRAGLRAVLISLALLAATTLVQAVILSAVGSVALLADLIHNLGDALTAIPVGAAFLLRSARAERLSGYVVVAAILVSAIVAAVAAVDRLLDPRDLEHLLALAAAGVVGVLGNEAAVVVRIRAGRRLASPALIADGHHARVDGLVSLGVVASAAAVALGAPIADPLIGPGHRRAHPADHVARLRDGDRAPLPVDPRRLRPVTALTVERRGASRRHSPPDPVARLEDRLRVVAQRRSRSVGDITGTRQASRPDRASR